MQTETITIEPNLAKPAPSRGRVLIVDDEAPNRMLLRDPLEAHHFKVAEVENATEALALIAIDPPDVILLDVMMPGMDGFEMCRRLRKNAITAHLPVLMVTALSERKERLMGIAAGANDFLNKPVDLPDVILRVANAVHAKHLFDLLRAERQKSERLLSNILPPQLAQRMKKGETNIADHHPDATVLCAELVGFTTLAAHLPPGEMVSLLNEIFSAFDLLVERHGLEKIRTVGDAYIVAGGLRGPRVGHAEAAAELALEMKNYLDQFNCDYQTRFQIRAGISSGPVISGVIGRTRFAYDIWGDTVNLACRLEKLAAPAAIEVSEPTCELLRHRFQFSEPRVITFTGANDVKCFTLGDRV